MLLLLFLWQSWSHLCTKAQRRIFLESLTSCMRTSDWPLVNQYLSSVSTKPQHDSRSWWPPCHLIISPTADSVVNFENLWYLLSSMNKYVFSAVVTTWITELFSVLSWEYECRLSLAILGSTKRTYLKAPTGVPRLSYLTGNALLPSFICFNFNGVVWLLTNLCPSMKRCTHLPPLSEGQTKRLRTVRVHAWRNEPETFTINLSFSVEHWLVRQI